MSTWQYWRTNMDINQIDVKENAIKAINDVGLYRYIEKPWDNDDLILTIKNAYERSILITSLQEKNAQLQEYSLHLEDLVKAKTQDVIKMNEQLSAVINNCADGIIIFSDKGEVIEVNPACETMFGLAEDIFIGKKAQGLFLVVGYVIMYILSIVLILNIIRISKKFI